MCMDESMERELDLGKFFQMEEDLDILLVERK